LDAFPISAQLSALVVLLVCSAFFSIAETSMMALNRYRLKALQAQGRRGAQQAAALLAQTDRLLSVILIGNNLLNAGVSALVTAMAITSFGNNQSVIAIATGAVAFLIIVFAEITPKVIGATYPEKIALPISIVLKPMLWVLYPLVWFVNLFVGLLLYLFRIKPDSSGARERMSPEELRMVVLESGHFMPQKHRSILLNLFDLERIRVEDVMTPRAHIEAIDLTDDAAAIARQLATSHHTRLVVYEGDINNVKGILHIRKAAAVLIEGGWTSQTLVDLLAEPYFIPQATPVFQQLQFFQERRQRLALVVDEYGELQGLVTLEDILEEMIGDFTTGAPVKSGSAFAWDADGTAVVEGGALLRELNRRLKLHFPLGGPKTLNGLILDHLQDIPESGVSLKIADCAMEILHTEDRVVRTVRLLRPPGAAPGPAR
jgi:Mg2+/Co2+ transporter CorB